MNEVNKDHVVLAWLHNGERPVTLKQVAHALRLDTKLHTGAANEEQRAAATRRQIGRIMHGVSGGALHCPSPRRTQIDELPPMDHGRFAQALAALAEQGEISLIQEGDSEAHYEPSAAERARYAA